MPSWSSAATEGLWSIFEHAHQKAMRECPTEPTKARRAGFDAIMGIAGVAQVGLDPATIEACAKVCEDLRHEDYSCETSEWSGGTFDCARAIRALAVSSTQEKAPAITSECCREDALAWEPCPPFQDLQQEIAELRARGAPLTLAEIERTICIEFTHSEDRASVRRAAERVFNFQAARTSTQPLGSALTATQPGGSK